MRYESKPQIVARCAEQIFGVASKFSNFTPMLADKVDSWQATNDTCSFKAQGFDLGLEIKERKEFELIKVSSTTSPMPFEFELHLKTLEPYSTQIEVSMVVELNAMLKMMVGGKLQGAVDKIAEQIANGLNGTIAAQ